MIRRSRALNRSINSLNSIRKLSRKRSILKRVERLLQLIQVRDAEDDAVAILSV